MKLYIYEHCPFSTRARMIFGLKQMPVELEVVMEGDSETPTRLVGKKVVPILLKDDGSAMAESMDIVRHVDSHFPPLVLTDPPREPVAKWCEEARPTVSRLAIPRMTKSSFKENATEASRKAYREREEKALGDLDALMTETPGLMITIGALLARLELILNDWKNVSETDLVLYSTLRSLSIVQGLEFGPKVRNFANRMSDLGGVALLDDRAI